MKIVIELESEQAQSLVDSMQELFEGLERKINHLKGRVRDLERTRSDHIKRFQALEGSHTE